MLMKNSKICEFFFIFVNFDLKGNVTDCARTC